MQRTVLITGASKGLGKTLAGFLGRQDTNLVLTARGPQSLQEVASAIRSHNTHVRAIPGDVADPEHRKRLAAAVAEFGRLDLLINNASTLGPTPMPALADFPLEAFRYLLDVNLAAPIGLVQATLPYLKAAGGLVVNLSSDAARGGYETWGGYGASKAALDLASLTLANELRDAGVHVVSVDPGDMQTQMHQEAYPGEDISDRALPEETLPFWSWLFGQDPESVNGKRFEAQAERWEITIPQAI